MKKRRRTREDGYEKPPGSARLLSGFFILSGVFDLRIFIFHSGRSNSVHHFFTSKLNICILVKAPSDLYIDDTCELSHIEPVISEKDFPYCPPVVTFADGNFNIVSFCIVHNIKHKFYKPLAFCRCGRTTGLVVRKTQFIFITSGL